MYNNAQHGFLGTPQPIIHHYFPESAYAPAGQSAGTWGPPPQQLAPPPPPPLGPVSDPTLPPGWVKQWNPQYQTWFFVNTTTQPPTSQWLHPGQAPINPGQWDPSRGGVSTTGMNGGYVGGPPHPGQYYATQSANGGLDQQQQQANHSLRGSAVGKTSVPSGHGYTTGAPSFLGTGPKGNYYGPSVPGHLGSTTHTQPVGTKSQNGSSTGKKVVAAGLAAMGGLAVGAIASHEWKEHERHEERERSEAYANGFQQAQNFQHAQLSHVEQHSIDRDDGRDGNFASHSDLDVDTRSVDQSWDNDDLDEEDDERDW